MQTPTIHDNPALYTVDPTDPEQRKRIDEAVLDAALRRGAIAPLWEVKTAKLQGDAGAADAGLSEEERAAKAGYAAPLDAAYAAANPLSNEAKTKRVGKFMPVALDLDGDERISQTSIAQQNQSDTDNLPQVTFNWDGQGFKKQTSWVKANDGFLVLDRDFNQSVDNGGELLSNPLVADPAKGMRGLATWDANGEFTTNLIALCVDSIRDRGQFGTQNTPETAQVHAVQPTHATAHCARPVCRPLRVEYHTSRAAHRPCAVASGWAGEAGLLSSKLGELDKQYKIDSTRRRIYAGE